MPAGSILVVAVDGLRASALGAYGNTSFPTPALDQFAAESFLFDWCYAPTADLGQLYRALWQSVHPGRGQPADDLNSPPPSLLQLLAAGGYARTLVTDEPELTALSFSNHFDQVVASAPPTTNSAHVGQRGGERPTITAAESNRAESISQTTLAHVFAAAADVIASESASAPQFVWVHARGMYAPWDGPLELQRSLLDESDPPPIEATTPPDFVLSAADDPDAAFRYGCAYSAQVMVLDSCWKGLLEALPSAGPASEWLVMLLGARGLPLGEHGRIGGVDPRMYGEQLHVPWLVRFPDGLGRLARCGHLASHIDLLPTLIHWLGKVQDPHPRRDGMSILPLTNSYRAPWRDALVAVHSDGPRAIRSAEWCLRQDAASGTELYVRPDDRWEANDVAKLCPGVVESLTGAMKAALEQLAQGEPARPAILPDSIPSC